MKIGLMTTPVYRTLTSLSRALVFL